MNSALIIFVRNPELGKVKTRLAAGIGNEETLKAYQFLLTHTYALIKDCSYKVYVYYHDKIWQDDLWQGGQIRKIIQEGASLGERMANAFARVFEDGYDEVVIIGSDCYELTAKIIEEAFHSVKKKDVVIGPAKDGGYYLLGMRAPFKDLFQNIPWSSNTVFEESMEQIHQNNYSVHLLPVLNDVDEAKDITFEYQKSVN